MESPLAEAKRNMPSAWFHLLCRKYVDLGPALFIVWLDNQYDVARITNIE